MALRATRRLKAKTDSPFAPLYRPPLPRPASRQRWGGGLVLFRRRSDVPTAPEKRQERARRSSKKAMRQPPRGGGPVGGLLTTRARIRYRRQERILRQANARIVEALSADQRRVLALSQAGYERGEIARELALTPEYVAHFMTGLVQRLTNDRLIPSPEWRNVLAWAVEAELLREPQ